ncbi:class I SAM-dependent RNA methyltransferase [uncultured Shimia sp.]|uniref:class I SAM-dependent RNA methyltransferase n=1 Tax=uncultured Shimia sp. TaxID=573152 RepID=UPI00261BA306|nr:class I SAM-dependent RNA methyltransferase [uncultured Shimia sp.]
MVELKIERLGHHGDGIAEGPVYVPLTLPGELVSGDLEGDRLTGVRIERPSDQRVKPPCRHFKSCGGCQLQHASDAFVSDWKLGVVVQALAAQGLEAEMRPIATSPPAARRRAVLSARRTKKGALVGFHQRASDVICEIPDCRLLHPDLMAAIPVAEALAVTGASRKGALSVNATLTSGGLDIAVTGGKPLDGPFLSQLAQEAEKLGLARLSWEGEVVATRQPPVQRFGRANVVPPPGAFLQATQQGEASLLAAVVEAVGEAGKQGVDLFAGCGTFTLPLAETFEMHAIEYDAPMLEALDKGWRAAEGLKKVTTEARDLFRNPLIPQDLKYDFVVIDPPRAGAEAQVRELAGSSVPVIAYVSCNPVTFARDAAILVAAGYQLDWVQVVDQFRWSSHIELAARFSAI